MVQFESVLDKGASIRLVLTGRDLSIARESILNAMEFVDVWRRGPIFGWEKSDVARFWEMFRDEVALLRSRHGGIENDSWWDPNHSPTVRIVLASREARLVADAHFAVLIALDPREFQTVMGFELPEVQAAGDAWIRALRVGGYQ